MVKHIGTLPANLIERLKALDWQDPWSVGAIDEKPSYGRGFEEEFRRELGPGHALFDVGDKARAVAGRVDNDDVLFWLGEEDGRFAVVHLTWSGRAEAIPEAPSSWIFASLDDFAESMAAEHRAWDVGQAEDP